MTNSILPDPKLWHPYRDDGGEWCLVRRDTDVSTKIRRDSNGDWITYDTEKDALEASKALNLGVDMQAEANAWLADHEELLDLTINSSKWFSSYDAEGATGLWIVEHFVTDDTTEVHQNADGQWSFFDTEKAAVEFADGLNRETVDSTALVPINHVPLPQSTLDMLDYIVSVDTDDYVKTHPIDHSVRAHAVLSASGCKRWWSCPGSVRASEGIANTTSEWAELGTAAHELANECLEQRLPASNYIGADFNNMEVTVEMADAVQVYLDACGEYMESPWEYYVERKFSLAKLNPPVAMFGTSDFTSLHRKSRKLVVVDYKNGAGVDVSVAGNAQLRYYALGALYSFDDMPEIEEVTICIVQPNTPGEDVKMETFHVAELIEWSIELMEHAEATQAPDAPLHAGEWCKFCAREGRCVEQARAAFASAQVEFEDMVEPDPNHRIVFPNIDLITPEQAGFILPRLDEFEAFSKAFRKASLEMAERGMTIPGQKVVPTRATEKWLDTTTAPLLLEDLGIAEDAVYEPRKVISPAQARAKIAELVKTTHDAKPGKKLTKKAAEERAKEIMQPMTHKVSSGNKLAPDADSRIGIPGSVHTDFAIEDAGVTIEGVAIELEIV